MEPSPSAIWLAWVHPCHITQALRITLTPQEEKLLAAKPIGDPRAYDHYLKGRAYARRMTRSDLDLALQMFEHAILLDPGFALAHAGIANACGLVYEWHDADPKWMERGRVYEVVLQPLTTSNHFAPGHRLRVEVSSSNFPRFDRNLNSGGNNYDEAEGVVAHNAVHHSKRYPSQASGVAPSPSG